MKFFYLSLLFTSALFCVPIDTKLYDNKERSSYYNEIAKQLEKDALEKVRDSEILKDEILQLSRVRSAAIKKVHPEAYDLKIFDSASLEATSYYTALREYSVLRNKKEKNTQLIADMQLKILYLKRVIENITEEEKPKLLSYQLQFAYYKLQQKNIEAKIALFKESSSKIKDALLQSFPKLECNESIKYEDKLLKAEKKLVDKEQEIVALELQKEKAVIEETKPSEAINTKMTLLNNAYQELQSQKISLMLTKAICLLKEKNSTSFYKTASDAKTLIDALSNTLQKTLLNQELNFLKDISKKELGRTNLLFGATIEETKEIFVQIKEFVFSTLFIFNERSITLFSLFKALFYIVLGFMLGVLYKKWILKITARFKDISMMSVRLVSNIGYYLIVLIFFIISVGSLGIDMSSLSLIAGALSIGIGFGLQTVVSNLIAGIILMFERTIRIGDIIEINNTLSGTVTDMRIRSTTIKTFDNIDVVVPNSFFIQNSVINLTLEDRIRRLHIPFGVAYGTEIEDVKSAVLNALEKSELIYVKNNEDQKADVRMVLMNSSSVDLELIVWVNRDPKIKKIPTPSDFLVLIYNALRANNINIPFPQLDVYVKHILDEIQKG